MLLWLTLACTGEKDTQTEDTNTPEDTAVTDQCTETANLDWPENVEWIQFDGQSSEIFSLADAVLSAEWSGNYGTYDLNTVAFEGANGFPLERPGQVVGAQVRWSNLPEEEAPVPLYFWPDFGSDGYIWDSQNPYTTETRCLSSADDGEWVDYVLPDPITLAQPLHVFAGYHRTLRDSGTPAIEPEILMENLMLDAEPFHAGAYFFDVDDELYYLGMTSPWYTWQIRLAVVYDDEIPPETKPFQKDESVSVSSRVAWGDFDNDGDDDLMSNGPQLWENQGDGSFVEVTDELLMTDGSSNGGVWGDFNNDGCLDYFGQGQEDILLQNACNTDDNGYIFTDVTATAGIHDIQTERDCNGDELEEPSPTEGSVWFDIDNDGWLDLYLANYECSSDFDFFKNYDDRVWKNNGDGTFTDWTEDSDILQSNQAGRGATTADYDRDGDIDVFVSNYRLDANFFYRNDGDGTLSDIAASNGTKGTAVSGAYGHTIGSAFGDIDGDLDLDLVQANLAHPFYYWFSDKSTVLINDGAGDFTDEAETRGIYYRETHSSPSLFDADNDGDLDLFITAVYASRDSDFYLNDGTGHFTLTNYESGLVQRNGWGAATADVDNDGDLELLAYDLFRNEEENGNWLQVRLFGGISGGPADNWGEWQGNANVSAIGTIVEIDTADGSQIRHVSGGSGTGVQDSLRLHFGVGSASEIIELRVFFPGGTAHSFSNIEANQFLWIHEDGTMDSGTDFPTDMIPQQAALE